MQEVCKQKRGTNSILDSSTSQCEQVPTSQSQLSNHSFLHNSLQNSMHTSKQKQQQTRTQRQASRLEQGAADGLVRGMSASEQALADGPDLLADAMRRKSRLCPTCAGRLAARAIPNRSRARQNLCAQGKRQNQSQRAISMSRACFCALQLAACLALAGGIPMLASSQPRPQQPRDMPVSGMGAEQRSPTEANSKHTHVRAELPQNPDQYRRQHTSRKTAQPRARTQTRIRELRFLQTRDTQFQAYGSNVVARRMPQPIHSVRNIGHLCEDTASHLRRTNHRTPAVSSRSSLQVAVALPGAWNISNIITHTTRNHRSSYPKPAETSTQQQKQQQQLGVFRALLLRVRFTTHSANVEVLPSL